MIWAPSTPGRRRTATRSTSCSRSAGLAVRPVHPIDIQSPATSSSPEFLKISPEQQDARPRRPATPGRAARRSRCSRSGAILHLPRPRRPGSFLPRDAARAHEVAAVADVADGRRSARCSGQRASLSRCMRRTKIEYAIDRYRNEAERLYGVLDRRLDESRLRRRRLLDRRHGDLALGALLRSGRAASRRRFPSVRRWFERVDERPAVKRGLQVLADRRRADPAHAGAARGDVRGAAVRATLRRGRWRR